MQKTIHSVIALLFCILMAFSLSACQDNSEPPYVPKSAVALWEKVDQTMSTPESMEITRTTQMVYYDMGYRFEFSSSAYVLTTKEAHYTESEDVVTCADLSLQQTVKSVEAYYDGKMYHGKSDGTYDQKFCSEMTHEEYDQTHTGEVTDELEIAGCTSAEFSKGENETWNLRFSGYTKKAINKVLETLSLTDDIFGASIEDMEVTMVADVNFYVLKMEIRFVFSAEAGEAMPAFSVVTQYSGYNTATFDPAKLNNEEYVSVAEVWVLDSVTVALQQRQEAVSGKFSLEMKTTYEQNGQTSRSQEKDVVTYGRKNGAYCHLITSEMDGQNFLIQYQSGEQTVTTDGQTHTAAQAEGEAKLFIDSLIDSAKYNSLAITDIQKQSDGVYTLTSDAPDTSGYINGIEVTSANQQITVTFSEGKLMRIESKIALSGKYSGEEVKMTADSVVIFDDAADAA